jgi:hypothetical protein
MIDETIPHARSFISTNNGWMDGRMDGWIDQSTLTDDASSLSFIRPRVPPRSVNAIPNHTPCVVAVAIAPTTNKRRLVLNVAILLPRFDPVSRETTAIHCLYTHQSV